MDATEKRLTAAYNAAVDRLKKIPKGDPKHIRASAQVIHALQALQRYQRRNRNLHGRHRETPHAAKAGGAPVTPRRPQIELPGGNPMKQGKPKPWRENEDGPDCACGEQTVVKILPDGQAILLCFFHTGEAGMYTPLPDERPEEWPT